MDIRCQQFTSHEISNNMLDMIGYRTNLYGQKVLENSCGEGNILGLIVERYILDAIDQNISLDKIKEGLESDIYGAEIVEATYNQCIDNLNMVAYRYRLEDVKWNVVNEDVLRRPFSITFDYIIGNPPYISYKNLELDVRNFIKDSYNTCKKGKPDYCYAFIENAISYLHKSGKMVYLIPNSIFKNVFGKDLRNLILPHLVEIYDYPNRKLFDNALTSSAVILLEKDSYIKEFQYNNVVKNYKIKLKKYGFGLADKWNFNLKIPVVDKVIQFDQLYKAGITIATQRNNVFVIDRETKIKYDIEQGALRRAISPRNRKYENEEYIIFPYNVREKRIIRFTEAEFKNKFPKAYIYLNENKKELYSRDSDNNARWFEYGRNQAVKNMNMKKLLLSTVVTNKIKVYDVSARAIPYSGIYIISEYGHDLDLARNILESEQFLEYVHGIGTPASGSSLRITSNDINKFTFKVGDFINE